MITNLFDKNKKDKRPWSRQDSINRVKRDNEHRQTFDNFRARFETSNPRFAVARREGKHFHVVGVGTVSVTTFAELKDKARDLGFTDIRFGAIKTAL